MQKSSFKYIFFSLAFFICIFTQSTNANEESFPHLLGPEIKVNAEPLHIHLIPHSHDDIGYIKTLDQYYYDSEKHINIEGVQYILDSILPFLVKDPTKRFVFVEIGFFKRWWDEQNEETRSTLKKLLQTKQFDFLNGGYCMNDEAAVYYEDSIDQMTLGHNFLLETFNLIPEIGWHIDPFGHASAQAALFAQMGFKAFFFARIDYQDQAQRVLTKGMETVWIPNTSQGIENAMFSHINFFHYASPFGFDFDILGHDDPVNDNRNLQGYNVREKALELVAWFKLMQTSYKSNHLMHTTGGDFQYMVAGMNYKNWDKLFKHIKGSSEYNVEISYNTPGEYLNIIYPLKISYPVKYDDFFPYADKINAYWTGYFTSRTAIKGLVRREGKLLQAAKRLATQLTWEKSSQFVLKNFNKVDKALYSLEEAMAIAQHHDAVTGTERELVANDYKYRLILGENTLNKDFLFPYFQEKIQADLKISSVQLDTCLLNTSAVFCDVTYKNLGKGTPVLVTIYNSGQTRNSTIRLKVPNGKVQVLSSSGQNIPTDVICSNSTDTSDCDLFFADQFAGFTTAYYYLKPSDTSNQVTPKSFASGQVYDINSNQSITTSSMSSFILTMCQDPDHKSCSTTQFNLKYNYYEAYQTNTSQVAGAYVFRPTNKTINSSLPYSTPQSAAIYQGKNLLHIHITGSNIITDIRIYQDLANGIEMQTFVNSISVSDNQGKEVIMIVEVPNIKNDKTFYTDSMGMEMQKRILNHRSTWPLIVVQPVAGNYYPIQSQILIQDTKTNESLTILPDRAQGGASMYNGEIEIMLHRRLLYDDSRGVGEALNELDWDKQGMRQWVTHTLLFNKPNYLETSHRKIQQNNDISNLVLLAPTSKTPFIQSSSIHDISKLGAFGDFGSDVKLLSRPLSTNKFLLRYHNMNENQTVNVPTSVFSNSNQNAQGKVTEMSLTANQPKKDMIKKRFNWNGLNLNDPSYAKTDYIDSDHFSLRPLEIRTFVVEFSSLSKDEELIFV